MSELASPSLHLNRPAGRQEPVRHRASADPVDESRDQRQHPGAADQRADRSKSADHCPVLIVEDDEDLREMMAQLLALDGFRAETVANGREALEYLKKGDFPDVILLDLMMPVMDGWEFRRQQQQDPALAAVPVVILSALDTARATDLLGTAFLKKPLDFDRLLVLVRRYCCDGHC